MTARRLPWWYLLFMPMLSQAGERVIELTVEDADAGVVVLHETDQGVLIDPEDIPPDTIARQALESLPRIGTPECVNCISLNDLGSYREDSRSGKGYLSLRPDLMPTNNLRFFKPREASAQFLQRRFAFINNFTFSVRDAEDEDTAGIGILQSSLSLGPLGVLETGVRHIENGELNDTRRLPTKLVNHFIDSQISFDLGEVRTDADPNDATIGITGFRIYRNFSTRPDITSRPVYDFFTLAERPSVIELYRNSQLERRQQIDRPGPVQLSDYRPSGSGKVLLVITDALGTRRLVETDLIVDQRNLGRGVWDFSLAGGYLRDAEGDIDKDAQAASFRVAYGVTERLTFGLLGEGASYQETSPLFSGNDYLWNAGASLLWNTAIGQLDATAKTSRDDLENKADSYRLSWRKAGLLGNRYHYSIGAAGFREDDQFTTIGGRRRQLEGWRAYAGLSFRHVFVSGNISETDDIQSYGLGLGWRAGRFSMDASVQGQDDEDPLFTLAFGYSFGGPVSYVQLGSQTREYSDKYESFLVARGRNKTNSLNWRAEAFHEDQTHSNRGSAGVGWASDHFNAAYEARYQNERYEQFADLGFALGFANAPALYAGRQLTSNEALAIVDTQLPHVGFSVEGRSSQSNRYGKGILPVTGFGRRFASIDTSTLPENNLVQRTLEEVSTVPGQAGLAKFTLNSPAAFIMIDGVPAGEIINVNGSDYRLYNFGAFAENLLLGENRIRYEGQVYILNIDSFDDSLPTYTLGRGNKQ